MSPASPFSTSAPLYVAAIIGLLIVLGYGLFAASPYLLGPSLTLLSPRTNETVTSPTVTVQGKTSRVSYLSVNEYPVPLREDGTFIVERTYPKGYTVLVVRARDRFGREVTDEVRFLHN